jgi:hypothetical protein
MTIFIDTETVGLCGPAVLIQWAEDDGPVTLYEIWKEPINETLELIEYFMNHNGGIVGFNWAFDSFQLAKIYTMLAGASDQEATPEELLTELALNESKARDGDCIKPVNVCDLMLHARKGPFQSLMNRRPIKIRKVPTQLAQSLVMELEQRIDLPDILFSKRANKALPKWAIRDCQDQDGNYDPHFKDLVLDFKASSTLKAIANVLLGSNRFGRDRLLYSEIEIEKKFFPVELGWAPFATAMMASPSTDWHVPSRFPLRHVRMGKRTIDIRGKATWPAVIEHHINHWRFSTLARQYAADDVEDTRGVWKAFGSPDPGDIDSNLSHMVGVSRWRGFAIDVNKIKELKDQAIVLSKQAPKARAEVQQFLMPCMTPIEKLAFKSTRKMVLEEIGGNHEQPGWQADCEKCDGEGCPSCQESGIIEHPAAGKARLVLQARKAKKDVEVYDKLLVAGRFHASFNVIGTLSNRMSGSDGLNPQAIRNEESFKRCFTLHWPGTVLSGGDFVAFEVSLAEANYNDAKLREQLQSGKKIHALFGMMCYPNMTYDEIINDKIIYTRSKSGFFSQIYGGNYKTLMTRLGVDEKSAIEAENRFAATYAGVRKARERIFNSFASMRQPAGIGTEVIWHEPADFIENMLDPPFKRYFTLENQICKALFQLANRPPKSWQTLKEFKVWRRDREQTVGGAVQSALYGAAFQIQASNVRAAANHVIQSTGAEITKAVQHEIWNLQPVGVHRWAVQPMNIHDELEVVCDLTLKEKVEQVVRDKVETYRPLVPLIAIEWHNSMESWGDK